MKKMTVVLTLCGALAILPRPALAAMITWNVVLDGLGENPPNGSPGTGLATVVLDDIADTLTVDLSFNNLTTGATAAHIHLPALPGMNAPIVFPFTLGSALGQTSGSIPQQFFSSVTPLQITALEGGLAYVNVHTSLFPAGEIRGQIAAVPEPSTVALLVAGLGGLFFARRRRAA
jgi:hypothetical protein